MKAVFVRITAFVLPFVSTVRTSTTTFTIVLTFLVSSCVTASGQASEDKPLATTATYRVTVESVEKKADNYTAVLVFENLTKKTITVRWLAKDRLQSSEGPYLVDEKGRKYPVEGFDTERVVNLGAWNLSMQDAAQILPGTKLKSRFLFHGAGNGRVFSLRADEFVDLNRKIPIAIDNIRVTTGELDEPPEVKLPGFTTESYRATVVSAIRAGDDLTITIIFESLIDNPFPLAWGTDGVQVDTKTGVLKSKEPYLIDEEASRFYLIKRDSMGIVGANYFRQMPDLLPRTKLKSEFVFRVSGFAKEFTLATREASPTHDRPVVIKGIRVTPSTIVK